MIFINHRTWIRVWACSILIWGIIVGCQHVNWANWVDWWNDHGDEVIDALPTPAPTPTPTPEPTPEPEVWHEPVYSHAQYDSGLPVGIHLTTGHDVLGVEPKGSYASMSCAAIQLQECATGEVYKINANLQQWTCPGGIDNWAKTYHWYTTAYVDNDASPSKIDNPTADGTRRGTVTIPWDKPGTWRVWVFWRASGNRTAHAWLGITQDYKGQEVTYWYDWNQRGNKRDAQIIVKDGGGGECLQFVVEGGVE